MDAHMSSSCVNSVLVYFKRMHWCSTCSRADLKVYLCICLWPLLCCFVCKLSHGGTLFPSMQYESPSSISKPGCSAVTLTRLCVYLYIYTCNGWNWYQERQSVICASTVYLYVFVQMEQRLHNRNNWSFSTDLCHNAYDSLVDILMFGKSMYWWFVSVKH